MKYPISLTAKLFPLLFSLCMLVGCENFPGFGGGNDIDDDDDDELNESISTSITILDINPTSVTFDGTKDQIIVNINAKTTVKSTRKKRPKMLIGAYIVTNWIIPTATSLLLL